MECVAYEKIYFKDINLKWAVILYLVLLSSGFIACIVYK